MWVNAVHLVEEMILRKKRFVVHGDAVFLGTVIGVENVRPGVRRRHGDLAEDIDGNVGDLRADVLVNEGIEICLRHTFLLHDAVKERKGHGVDINIQKDAGHGLLLTLNEINDKFLY